MGARDWLRRVVDICCKLRGYKAEVVERRVIQAGSLPPSDSACVADSREQGNGHDATSDATESLAPSSAR